MGTEVGTGGRRYIKAGGGVTRHTKVTLTNVTNINDLSANTLTAEELQMLYDVVYNQSKYGSASIAFSYDGVDYDFAINERASNGNFVVNNRGNSQTYNIADVGGNKTLTYVRGVYYLTLANTGTGTPEALANMAQLARIADVNKDLIFGTLIAQSTAPLTNCIISANSKTNVTQYSLIAQSGINFDQITIGFVVRATGAVSLAGYDIRRASIYRGSSTLLTTAEKDLAQVSLGNTADGVGAGARNMTLRALFVAAGATFNSTTGLYTLGDITDLTEAEMLQSYTMTQGAMQAGYIQSLLSGLKGVRVNFPALHDTGGSGGGSAVYAFSGSSLTTLMMRAKDTEIYTLPASAGALWGFCRDMVNLVTVYGVLYCNYTGAEPTFLPFSNCVKLVTLKWRGLDNRITFATLAALSRESVRYMIDNRGGPAGSYSAITITLHPDAYARLTSDDFTAATANNITIAQA